MKKFRVYASYVNYCYLDVDAEDAEEALMIADCTDGSHFTPDDLYGDGDWKLEKVEEIDE